MNKKVTLILLILVSIVLLGGAYILYNQYAQQPPAPPESETAADTITAPDFTVYDAQGDPVRLSDYLGKPVVLNFWASWCGPCRSEMPAFQKAFETYGNQVQFLMVNMTDGSRETPALATEFIENADYSFPVFFDTDYDAAMAYHVYSLPTTVLIDEKGNFLTQRSGAMSYSLLENVITALLP